MCNAESSSHSFHKIIRPLFNLCVLHRRLHIDKIQKDEKDKSGRKIALPRDSSRTGESYRGLSRTE